MENNTATKPKKKLHFWLWPLLIGFVLTIAGQFGGLIGEAILVRIFDPSDMWRFSLDYAAFSGIWVCVLLFTFLVDRPVFKTFFPARKGGLKGNSIKEFLLGLLIGFIMNGGCILFGLPNSGIVSQGSFLHLEAASPSFWYDPTFGIEGTIPSVIAEVLLCAWALWLIFRNKKKEA